MYGSVLKLLKKSILNSHFGRFCIFRYKIFNPSLKKSVISLFRSVIAGNDHLPISFYCPLPYLGFAAKSFSWG
ncbi:unknown protein [Microcystis aeruginosa NIES-843]|uniref:Uncharacterized protein n=1 Tax=Microcystis aeruginosa (strain NIES-843 / IAM M-2473) TaxID=449447 RepID=B0JXC3_MICAN|nr:unknown protein [Microcystis aeruginosa NIES-843]